MPTIVAADRSRPDATVTYGVCRSVLRIPPKMSSASGLSAWPPNSFFRQSRVAESRRIHISPRGRGGTHRPMSFGKLGVCGE